MLNDDAFRHLLHVLDRPWTGFRKVRKGVKKRLRRHMQSLGCSTVEQYLRHLQRQPAAMAACHMHLRVTISRFYRDRQLWQCLQHQLLPELVNRFSGPLHCWSAGCACGEEPYTLAMIGEAMDPVALLDLLATDADETCLQRARRGCYPPSSMKEVPADMQAAYFQPQRGGRRMCVRRDRLPLIRWQRHDLLDPLPEPGPFHLILLRNNLLTYYQGASLRAALERIVAGLVAGGFLVIGAREQLPPATAGLTTVPSSPWVYRRKACHRTGDASGAPSVDDSSA